MLLLPLPDMYHMHSSAMQPEHFNPLQSILGAHLCRVMITIHSIFIEVAIVSESKSIYPQSSALWKEYQTVPYSGATAMNATLEIEMMAHIN